MPRVDDGGRGPAPCAIPPTRDPLIDGESRDRTRAQPTRVAEAPGWRAEPRSEGIDPAADAASAATFCLVPEGVGKCLDRMWRAEAVAVLDEGRVEVGEGELAVTAEQGKAGPPQVTTPEDLGIRGDRRQRRTVHGGGSHRVEEQVPGPQRLAQPAQSLSHIDPPGGESLDLALEVVELVVESDAFGGEHASTIGS